MNIVDLGAKKADTTDILSAIDALRKEVEEGRVVAFASVGIGPDLSTRMWSGRAAGANIKRLHVMGAIANLEYCYHSSPEDSTL